MFGRELLTVFLTLHQYLYLTIFENGVVNFFAFLDARVCSELQGESVNILLNFTQFFETRIEYRFQIFTAHSCDFLLPSYARLA